MRVLPTNPELVTPAERINALLHYLEVQRRLSLELYEHGQHPKDIELARFAEKLSTIVRTLFPDMLPASKNLGSEQEE